MKSIRVLSFLMAALVFSGPTFTATAEAKGGAKLRKIHKLMKLTGAAAMTKQMMARLKATLPNVPPSFWKKVLRQQDIQELMNQVAAVYAKHLTMRDVDGLIAFFSSPVGRRFVKLQPQLLRDSMQVGQAWGMKMNARIQDELKKQQK
jgi:hypothetical protein